MGIIPHFSITRRDFSFPSKMSCTRSYQAPSHRNRIPSSSSLLLASAPVPNMPGSAHTPSLGIACAHRQGLPGDHAARYFPITFPFSFSSSANTRSFFSCVKLWRQFPRFPRQNHAPASPPAARLAGLLHIHTYPGNPLPAKSEATFFLFPTGIALTSNTVISNGMLLPGFACLPRNWRDWAREAKAPAFPSSAAGISYTVAAAFPPVVKTARICAALKIGQRSLRHRVLNAGIRSSLDFTCVQDIIECNPMPAHIGRLLLRSLRRRLLQHRRSECAKSGSGGAHSKNPFPGIWGRELFPVLKFSNGCHRQAQEGLLSFPSALRATSAQVPRVTRSKSCGLSSTCSPILPALTTRKSRFCASECSTV